MGCHAPLQRIFPTQGLNTGSPALQKDSLPTELPGTQVQSLGWEDIQETEMATHSHTLAWRIPWKEEPGGLQSMGLQRVGHD